MSDDTPTLPLPGSPPPAAPPTVAAPLPPLVAPAPPSPRSGPPSRPSRAPLIAFIIVAVLVLVASSFLLYILTTRGLGTPSSAPTSSTPTAPAQTPPPPVTQAPPPAPAGLFTSFTTPASQQCDKHGKGRDSVEAQVAWVTQDATQVWVAAGTADAVSAGGQQAPLSGDQDDLETPLVLDCASPSETFTMTLIGSNGAHVSRTWTVELDSRR
jgi:hypothetical protein